MIPPSTIWVTVRLVGGKNIEYAMMGGRGRNAVGTQHQVAQTVVAGRMQETPRLKAFPVAEVDMAADSIRVHDDLPVQRGESGYDQKKPRARLEGQKIGFSIDHQRNRRNRRRNRSGKKSLWRMAHCAKDLNLQGRLDWKEADLEAAAPDYSGQSSPGDHGLNRGPDGAQIPNVNAEA